MKKVIVLVSVIAMLLVAASQSSPAATGWKYDLMGTMDGNRSYPDTSLSFTGDPVLYWQATGSGNPIALTGDVDGDTNLEIIFSTSTSVIIFNSSGNIENSFALPANARMSTLLADFDSDGDDDIFIGGGEASGVITARVYDSSGTELQTFVKSGMSSGGYFTPKAIVNNKIIMNGMIASSGEPRGPAAFTATGTERWYYDTGMFTAYSFADYDSDGKYEITGSWGTVHNGGAGCGYLNNGTCTTDGDMYTLVVDEDGNEVFTQIYPAPSDSVAHHYFTDITDSGTYRMFAFEGHTTTYPGMSQIHELNTADGAPTNTADVANNYNFGYYYSTITDIDNDGSKELVTQDYTTCVFVAYSDTLVQEASNTVGSANCAIFASGDIDGDGMKEIIAVTDSTKVAVLDETLSSQWTYDTGETIIRILLSDIDDNDYIEIIVTTNNKLMVFGRDINPPTFSGIETITSCGSGCLELGWSAATDAEGSTPITYNIYQSTTSGGQNFDTPTFATTSTSPQVTGLTDGQQYYFVVHAEDSLGNEDTNTTQRNMVPFAAVSMFANSWTSTESEDTFSIQWGDMDGDGDLDMAVGGYSATTGTKSRIMRNDGADVFTMTWTSTDNEYAADLKWVDYDGDGDCDLASANTGSVGTRLYRNDGGSVFSLEWNSPGSFDSTSFSWGDFDNDGDLDFVSARTVNEVYRNNGDSTFTVVWTSLDYSDNAWGVDWGDYDNDGDIDFIAAYGYGSVQANRVFKNAGNDEFSNTWISSELEQSKDIRWGDYDGDGDLDHLVANRGTSANSVYRNDGSDSFFRVWTSNETDSTMNIRWVDIDGDGDLDHFAASQNVSNKVYFNIGGDSFKLAWGTTETENSIGCHVGDYDADGDIDLLVSSNGGGLGEPNRIYRNNLNTNSTTPTVPTPTAEADIFGNSTGNEVALRWSAGSDAETTDVDLLTYDLCIGTTSGNCDVFAGLYPWSGISPESTGFGNAGATTTHFIDLATGTYYWSVRTVDATFKRSAWSIEDSFTITGIFESVWASVESEDNQGCESGDIDGDGDLDFVVTGWNASNKVYTNNGDSTFTLSWASTETDYGQSISLGDYDGDGDLDQLIGNGWTSGEVNRVYRNDGIDNYILVWSSSELETSEGIIWGDYDNDGDMDQLVSNGTGEPVRIYRNDGNDTFTVSWSSTETGNTIQGQWGDYDNDGDIDAIVCNSGASNFVYRNDTGDSFTTIWSSSETDSSVTLALGDYDGDGNLDQLVGNFGAGESNRVYKNDSGDSFSLIWSSTETDVTSRVAWGDYDGDGDIDQFSLTYDTNPNRIYRNDGSDVFTLDWSSTANEVSECISLADIDNDGDIDQIVTNTVENRIYQNNLNHTNTTPTAPTPTAEADIFGNSSANEVPLQWSAGSDTETTNADLLTYDVCIGTTTGNCDVFAGLFPWTGTSPESTGFGNVGATTTHFIDLATGTYYWSVRTVDTTFKRSAWSTEDSFTVTAWFEDSGQNLGANVAHQCETFDIEGDGDLDLLMVHGNTPSGAQPNKVWVNDGFGIFTDTVQSIGNNRSYNAVPFDADRDGDLDIVQANSNSGGETNQLFINDGSGVFSDSGQTIGMGQTIALSVADIDDDGDMDVILGNAANEANQVYVNDGNGTFSDSGQSLGANNTFVILTADVDGDNDIDFIEGNMTAEANRIWLNDGNGNFSDSGQALGTANTYYGATIDVDGDRDIDFVVTNGTNPNVIWLNDGFGNYSDSGQTPGSNGGSMPVVFDPDGDGDLDIFVPHNLDANRLWMNDGLGGYSDAGITLSSNTTYGVCSADVDSDGDVDIFEANYNQQSKLWINNSNNTNTTPTVPTPTAEADIIGNSSANEVALQWSAGSDAETTNADLLTYDVCIGTTSGNCDVFAGLYPWTGTSPESTGFGNAGATTTHFLDLATGTYYWSVRTVDATFKRSAWSIEDSFTVTAWFEDSGQALGSASTRRSFAADFDADADIDVVFVNYPETHEVWLNDGSGTYSDSGQTITASDIAGLIGADIDNDGDIDLFLGVQNAADQLWLNSGGVFSNSGQSLATSMTKSLDASDVDSDGDMDLIVGSRDNQPNLVYMNDGTGSFTDSGQSLGSYYTYSVYASDLDSDGDPDFISGNANQANRIWLNDGTGVFTDSGQALGSSSTYWAIPTDIDADGDDDIVVANGTANKVWINDGSAAFSDSGQIFPSEITVGLSVIDIDADSDFDFVAGNDGEPNSVWLNDGSGYFTDSGLELGANNTTAICTVDIDADGDADIIEGNVLSQSNRIWINNKNHTNTTPTAPTLTAEADFFGNSTGNEVALQWSAGSDAETVDANLLTYDLRIGTTSNGCEVFCGTGVGFGNAGATTTHFIELATGTFYWSVRTVDTTFKRSAWSTEDSFTVTAWFEDSGQRLGSSVTTALFPADVDGDGDFDMMAANSDGQANKVYLNNGSAVFTDSGQSLGTTWTTAVYAADVDGDGDLDFMAGNTNSQGDEIYLNDGAGNFTNTGQSLGSSNAYNIAVADFNSDGAIDYYAGNWNVANKLYINDGTGTFSDSGQSFGTFYSYDVDVSDVDRDGDIDVISGNSSQMHIIYLNDGTGTLTDSGQTLTALSTWEIAIADIDADSDDDYALCTGVSGSKVWTNDGSGAFSDSGQSFGAEDTRAIGFADVDGDGDLDLLHGNFAEPNGLFLNDGAGSFSDSGQAFGNNNVTSIMPADLDGDGDLDIMTNDTASGNMIWINNLNHTNTAPSAPTVTAEADIFGNSTGNEVALQWSAGSDTESAVALLTYDIRIGTTSNGCEVFCNSDTGFGNAGATTTHFIDLATGTYYWSVRTVDTTFKRSAWSAEDSFTITGMFDVVWTSTEADSSTFTSWGDYDGDGDLDFTVANDGVPNRVYQNDGGALFSLVWSSTETDDTRGIEWGDYDGDGDMDIVASNYGAGAGEENRIYRNDGGGTFTLAWSSTESDLSFRVSWGDYDNDGDLDHLAANTGGAGNPNRVYRNDGGNVFTLVWSSTETDSSISVDWGDCDGDGKLDQLIGNYVAGGQANRVYLNAGSDTFTSVWTSTEADQTYIATWGDYDGDGDLDQAVGNGNGVTPNRVYRNDGGLSFTLVWTSTETDYTEFIGWGDYDGDGDLDQLAANVSASDRLYRNDGGAVFSLAWSSDETDSSYGSSWGDYDGDGDLDFSIVNYSGQQNRLYRNNINPTITAPTTPIPTAEADVFGNSTGNEVALQWSAGSDAETTNADLLSYDVCIGTTSGNCDVFAGLYPWSGTSPEATGFGNAGATTTQLIDNLATGTYYWAVRTVDTTFKRSSWSTEDSFVVTAWFEDSAQALGGGTALAAESFDADGDGDIDIVAGNSAGGSGLANSIYLNDGTGTLTDSGQTLGTEDTHSLTVSDFDNDGDLDIASANYNTFSNKVYTNDGSGIFADSGQSLGPESSYSIRSGDFDTDGDVDLLTGNNAQSNKLWVNNGAGTFTDAGITMGSTEFTCAIDIADFDRDGDLDYYSGNAGAVDDIWLNDGSGNFSISQSTVATDDTYYVLAIDVDGDSYPDIITGNYNNQGNRVYLNDGSGSFNDSGASLGSYSTYALSSGDVDGDGDIDFAEGIYTSEENNIWINDGAGVFSDAGVMLGGNLTGNIELFDADNDGDLDVFESNYSVENLLWINNIDHANTTPVAPTVTAEADMFGNSTGNEVTLQWSAGSDAETTNADLLTYDVCIGTTSGNCDVFAGLYPWAGSSPESTGFGNAGATTTHFIDLATGTFYWSVRTVDTTFKRSAWSMEDSFSVVSWFEDSSQALDSNSTMILFAMDVDGDGDVDYVEGNFNEPNKVWLNDGTGAFSDSGQGLGADGTYGVCGADVDGDGDMDIFEGIAEGTMENKVWLNNGSGTFADSGQLIGANNTSYVAAADVDLDGDIDLFEGNAAYLGPGEPNKLWYNNGSGVFLDSGQSLGTLDTWSLAVADVDGDGDADLVVGNSSNSANEVYINDGTGILTDSAQALGSRSSESVFTADVDGDGDVDIIAGNHNQGDTVWINDGAGSYTDSGQSHGSASTISVFGADLDGDGDIDFVEGNRSDQPNVIMVNSGAGVFSDSGITLGANSTWSVVGADIDGDGDVDIIEGNDIWFVSANKVWINNIDNSGNVPTAPSVVPETDVYASATTTVTLQWTAGSDVDTTDVDLLTYDICVGTASGACDVLAGLYPWAGVAPAGNGPGNAGAVTFRGLRIATGTYYWSVRTVDTTFKRSAWSTEDSFVIDSTPPSDVATVNDGTGADAAYADSMTQLSANWSASTDAQSGVAAYWYSIGTAAGATDVVDWTNAGAVTAVTATGLSLNGGSYYYFSIKAQNGVGAFSGVTSSDGVLGDSGAPSIMIVSPAAGAPVSGNVTVTGSVEDPSLSAWQLYYGAGASPSSWSLLNSGSIAVIDSTLGSWDSSAYAGTYSLKLAASDTAGFSTSTTQTVSVSNNITVSGTVPMHKWVLMSAPAHPSGGDPVSMFGSTYMSKVYRWNPQAESQHYISQYEYPETVEAGDGFWVKVYDTDMPYSYTGALADTSTDYVIQLYEGWNQIGTPFNAQFTWGSVQVRSGGSTYDLMTASSMGIVSSTITSYDEDAKSWVQGDSSTAMQLQKGYEVRAYADCELLFDPTTTGSVARQIALSKIIRPRFDFRLRISATVGDIADVDNYIATAPDAEAEFDAMDFEEPHGTPDSSYISLYFPHDEWSRNPGRYTNDTRRSLVRESDSEAYDFTVQTSEAEDIVTLSWDTGALPSDTYSFVLVVLSTGERIDMTTTASYSYTAPTEGGAEEQFRVEIIKLITETLSRTHTLQPGWNLISTPLDPEVTSALEQLGDDLPLLQVFQLFDGQYFSAEEADIQAGLGYWVYVADNTEIDITGLPVSGDLQVPLKSGWNLIGNPYESSIEWDDGITFKCSSQQLALSQAVEEGITDGLIYAYTGGDYKPATVLEPWKGYFMKGSADCVLLLTK